MRRISALGSLFVVAVLVVGATACGGESHTRRAVPATTVPASAATSVAAKPSSTPLRKPAVYAGGQPGTKYASDALKWAASAGFGTVINYSAIDAPQDVIKAYLAEAHGLGLKVVLSVKDLLGPTDLDPANLAWHQQFGTSTSAQITGITDQFTGLPGTWGYSTSDELPGNPDDESQWLPALQQRHRQIAGSTLVTLYWTSGANRFYSDVAKTTTDLSIDRYPLPDGATAPTVIAPETDRELRDIGTVLGQVAGKHGWFTEQAFGYGNGSHPEGPGVGVAPTTDQMVAMAKAAVQGGAYNLIFFSYDDNAENGYGRGEPANLSQLAAIKAAVAQITGSDWWRATQ